MPEREETTEGVTYTIYTADDDDECCPDGCCPSCHPECHEEEDEVMGRDWVDGPHEGDEVEGEFIRTTRTVGVEYERGSYTGTPGWDDRLLSEVGIGTDHCGIEVRTPPAKGMAADRFTRHTLEELIASGFPTGNDSGLHVHVHFPEALEAAAVYDYSSNDYTRDTSDQNTALARFLALWAAVECIAFRFAPHRRTSSWSRAWVGNREDRIEKTKRMLAAARDGSYIPDLISHYGSVYCQTRYTTIEFRGHSSTNDVPHVMAWVAFVQGIVDLSTRISYIGIMRLARAKSHDERAELLMRYGQRHSIWTKAATAGIRHELGLSKSTLAGDERDQAEVMPARRAA